MAKHCTLCNIEISGEYFSTGQKIFCKACYRNEYTCTECGNGIEGNFYIKEEQKVCSSCYRKISSCSFCKGPLPSEYYIIADKKICDRCFSRPRCFLCGTPAGADLIPLEFKSYVCRECRPSVIMDEKDLAKALVESYKGLSSVFAHIARGVKITRLEMTSQSELARKHRRTHDRPFSVAGDASSDGVIKINRNRPLAEAIEIIVHEMGHLWQYGNWQHFHAYEKYKVEGFCEWLSYKVLLSRNDEKAAAHMLENADPVYGYGLKYILKLEKKGLSADDIIHGRF